MSFKNTYSSGSVRNIIFKEGDVWFGVTLEFNIVETGDSPEEVMILLDNAIKGYVESAEKSHLSISVLNQEVDPEYEALWNLKDTESEMGNKRLYSATTQPLAALRA